MYRIGKVAIQEDHMTDVTPTNETDSSADSPTTDAESPETLGTPETLEAPGTPETPETPDTPGTPARQKAETPFAWEDLDGAMEIVRVAQDVYGGEAQNADIAQR